MIPVVDFSKYSLSLPKDEVETEVLLELAEQICTAFKTVGFVYLKNHGFSEQTIQNLHSVCKEFYDKPISLKQKYKKKDGPYGWVPIEEEKFNKQRPVGDLKESITMTPTNADLLPVDILPTIRQNFMDMFIGCQELAWRILDVMSIGLGIDREYLRTCHQKIGEEGNHTALRTLYYPPVTHVKEGQIRCGEHSDFGTITLLFQDDAGGLEVKPPGYEYFDATPMDDTVLVNIGDVMQRWTSDKLIATKHRVVIPKEEISRKKGRRSIAFFVHPDDEVIIECLDKSGKYEPIKNIDYLYSQFANIY